VIELKPKTQCERCGEIIVQTGAFIVRQVTDIQIPRVITLEYRAEEGVCTDCGKVHKASFPEGVCGTVGSRPKEDGRLSGQNYRGWINTSTFAHPAYHCIKENRV
jgi:hypothetical protein